MNPINELFEKIERFYLQSKKPKLLEILLGLFLSFIAIILLFYDFYNNILSIETLFIYKAILVSLAILQIIILTKFISKLRNFRYQILARNAFIEKTVSDIRPKYKIKKIHDSHEIISNGDSDYCREVTLEYDGENVSWYKMSLGSNNGIPLEKDIKLKVINLDHENEHILANLPYRREDYHEHYAILLDPILSEENREIRFLVRRQRWSSVWDDLINKQIDKANIKVDYPVENFELTIIAPKYHEISYFRIDPKIGEVNKTFNTHGLHMLTLSADNVQPSQLDEGKYTYTVKLTRLTKKQWNMQRV